jgi:23S rRNA pseudouridine1911/1915/1917 synthase
MSGRPMSNINGIFLSSPVTKKQRIHHFKLDAEWDLIHFIETHLGLEKLKIIELLKLGSIYCNRKRLFENLLLQIGDYLRVHTEPRRFQIKNKISDLVFFEDPHFLAINKPGGIPCHPTLDNYLENILNLLRVDRHQEFYLCHRLDIGTQGLLLFAKSAEIQTHMMNNWQTVGKIYRTQTNGPQLKPQRFIHWMLPHPRAPKIIASHSVENWHLCELKIMDSKSFTLENNEHFNEYTIELLTGRSHQIRAQLSFEQNPIIGDQMYGSQFEYSTNSPLMTNLKSDFDYFALKCVELSFEFLEKSYRIIL